MGRVDRLDGISDRLGRQGHHGGPRVVEISGQMYVEAPKNRKFRKPALGSGTSGQ
jgi:hypothetical protein